MQHSSLFVKAYASIFVVLSAFPVSQAAPTSTLEARGDYKLQTTYSGSSFFNGWDFSTNADTTHGFVTYVDQSTAQNSGLIKAAHGSPVIMAVDSTNTYDGTKPYWGINGVGRPTVRIESQQRWTHGLFIADIANMPGGVCGIWPSFWTLGDGTWPSHGEIDVIEQVNTASADQSAVHTANTCTMPGPSSPQTGNTISTNCTVDTQTGANTEGCEVTGSDPASFGLNFNGNGGGVYAMEWTSQYIKMFFFPRNSIPADVASGNPNPSSWGNPYANYQGDCDIDSNFQNHQLIIDTTFCGDWAGTVWNDQCAASTGESSCSVYVGNNPGAFKDMHWAINSVKVYQQ